MTKTVGPGQIVRLRVRRFVDADGRTANVDETYGIRYYPSNNDLMDVVPEGDPPMQAVVTFTDSGTGLYVEVEADADLSEKERLFRGRSEDIDVVAGEAVGAELLLDVEMRADPLPASIA